MQLVLASTSRYRRALMERLGLPFAAAAPRFEELTLAAGGDPSRLVVENAMGKAASLAGLYSHALIIGSDQVAACEGRLLTKPGSAARAVEQLLWLSGREHRLLTGLAVVVTDSGAAHTAIVESRLRVRILSRAEAEAYVAREHPLDCAGAYKSEGLGICLFEYLRGDDPTAIIGLPLIALSGLLRRCGVEPLGALPSGAGEER